MPALMIIPNSQNPKEQRPKHKHLFLFPAESAEIYAEIRRNLVKSKMLKVKGCGCLKSIFLPRKGLNMNIPYKRSAVWGHNRNKSPTPKVLNVLDHAFPAEIAEKFAEIRRNLVNSYRLNGRYV